MLESLHIRNYVLIDELDIRFPEGLVIITGQTGAGKSILLGALSLVTGGKGDASLISDGAESCVVEAGFRLPADSGSLRALLEENDLDWEDGSLSIRRVLYRSGRSRSFVNDVPATAPLLAELATLLIDIHSQHQSLLLTDPAFQLRVLDHFAGNTPLLEETAACWRSLQQLRREHAELQERIQRLEAERSYNQAQYNQLEAAHLRIGELEELEQEQEQLAHAEQIKESFAQIRSAFEPQDGAGIDGSLREIRRLLERSAKFIPALQDLSGRVESARIELADIRDEAESQDERISLSEERLATVEERMSLLYGLMKKHSCQDIAELCALRDRYAGELDSAASAGETLAEMAGQIEALEARHRDCCSRLHERRNAAAGDFQAQIESSLHFLEMYRAVFRVGLSPAEAGASGSDRIHFLFSASGAQPVDVARCASGGEISRIMLCLKEMMARFVGMPTLIFDEIDTGVSGSAADRMGQLICTMGASMQVFAITHLPQVAAKGSAHYLVSKTTDPQSGRTVSGIAQISGEDRVREIARMLSGATLTPEAIANAQTLLKR